MRYCNLSWFEFYSCYLQQCLSIDLFFHWTPARAIIVRKVIWIKSVFLYRSFLWIGSLVFSGTQQCQGTHLVFWQSSEFFEKNTFGPKNGENRPCLRFFKYMVIFLIFFWILSIIEVYINWCMHGKILGNFGSWVMCQNILAQSDWRIFKSIISLEQNDEKLWFFACWYKMPLFIN